MFARKFVWRCTINKQKSNGQYFNTARKTKYTKYTYILTHKITHTYTNVKKRKKTTDKLI